MISFIVLGIVPAALAILLNLFFSRYFRPKLYFAESPVSVTVKDSPGSKKTKQESLRTFIETRCPSLLREFRPVWWLFSGHLQTGYSVVGDFTKVDKVEYERTSLRTVDGGTLGLDFTPPQSERKLSDDTPIAVVLHGLTGGSHESYVRAVLAPVCTPKEQGGLGYRAVVVNFRGCAGVPITSPQLYSAGHTEDIRVAVYYIRKKYPCAPLLGLGFSLGANVLVRYLSEEGENSRLSSACVLACPWDLLANSIALEGRWFHRKVYSSALGTNLQSVVKRHASALLKFPSHPVGQAVTPCLALQAPTMEAFDNTFNRIAGGSSPPFPFPSAQAYYVWASSHDRLSAVRVPLLALNTADDPIVQVLPVEAGGNGFVAFAVTRKGGHLGWFQAGKRRWFSKPVVEWLRAVGEDVVGNVRKGKALREVDGFIKEMGRDDIGCMELEVGRRVAGVEGQEGVLAGL
ncbi:AB-hydrolase YheT [Wolfiporia cocos MD-104 SS10]|uniref:AB-hydrolase YheT n=1 Tax=Wolfiporia cocos (strain MD-104) TaxID=742152 RepID=A0A2H3J769_WOLCO|nr:AB-hydrolase YheT [Wolfiporia cocos MD-104 SS10]